MSKFTNAELARLVKQGLDFADMYLEQEQQLKDCQAELEDMTYRAKDYYDMIMKIPEKELQKHGIIVITTGETLKGELNNDTINSKRFHECGN